MSRLTKEIMMLLSKKYARITAEKKVIRDDIREIKKSMPEEQRQLDSDKVFAKIEALPEFLNAKIILLYWAIPGELPTQRIANKWCKQKQILLPSIDKKKLVLKIYSPEGKLTQARLGFFEPELKDNYEGNVDLVIAPGIAFDRHKNRMGRGKGYYDRFFKLQSPYKIGVGFDFQLLEDVPIEKHDVKMDIVFTPSETIE